MRTILLTFLLVVSLTVAGAQVPIATQVQILKAEDARRYDAVLEGLLKSPNAAVRVRAALAAGRIGDAAAVPALIRLLGDPSEKVREMAAFALGETESMEAADAIRIALGETARAQMPGQEKANVRGRLVEAAGKIAAANAQAETRAVASVPDKTRGLKEAIVFSLERELQNKAEPNKETILLALTAALRARPENADLTVRKFLAFSDPDIVATALNTLSRLRAKNANRDARDLLETHTNAGVRANAAGLLGAAEDKDAVDLLIKTATKDTDSRVRVSAIRSLAALKEQKAANSLLERGRQLLKEIELPPGKNPPWYGMKPRQNQPQRNELIEISTAVRRLLPNSDNAAAVGFLNQLGKSDRYTTTEVVVALATVSPTAFSNINVTDTACYGIGVMPGCERFNRNHALGFAEFARLPEENIFRKKAVEFLEMKLSRAAESVIGPIDDQNSTIGLLEAYSAFKDAKPELIIPFLKLKHGFSWDPFIRATAAGILADLAPTRTNGGALRDALEIALKTDKHDNDAQLALLDATSKVDAVGAVDTIYRALDSPDYLVRKKALALLDDPKLLAAYPGAANVARDARARHKDQVWPYDAKSGTKLGQMLNKDVDYRRALSRKNGSISAVLTTQKGTFTIEFLPEDAPLTVDNFVKLARAGYFNGLEVHRVVPNFVMQDGDPRGDGNGGPGWSIRCEVNMVPYERGAVGMALSGKDTGGSQWFVTHSPQPHLDGGYTVFGRVNETGMKVVDKIVRGDKIVSVRIVGR